MKKSKKSNLIITIINIILVVLSISLIYSLFKLNIFKIQYLLLFYLLIIIFDYFLLKNKNKITNVFSIILIIIYFILITSIITTFDFIETVTKPSIEYQEYSVIVKDEKIGIKDLKNKKIGFIKTSNIDDIKETFSKSANISIVTRDFESNNKLVSALKHDKVDAIVVNSNSINVLNKLYEKYKNIYKYDVKLDYNYNSKIDKSYTILITGNTKEKDLNKAVINDTNILMNINNDKKIITFIYIPSNLLVRLDETTGDKDSINNASIYGVDKTIKSLNNKFDININYYIKTNKLINKNSINKIKKDSKSISIIFNYNKILKENKNNYSTNISYNELIKMFKDNMFNNYKINNYEIKGDKKTNKSYTFDEEYEVIKINDDEVNNIKKIINNGAKND